MKGHLGPQPGPAAAAAGPGPQPGLPLLLSSALFGAQRARNTSSIIAHGLRVQVLAPRLSVACCHSLCGILCDMGLRVDAPEFTPGGTVRSPLKSAWCTGVDSVAAQSHGARSFPRQQGVARVQVEPMEVYILTASYDDSDIPVSPHTFVANFWDYLDGPYRRPT